MVEERAFLLVGIVNHKSNSHDSSSGVAVAILEAVIC